MNQQPNTAGARQGDVVTLERQRACPVTPACESAIECVTISEGGLHGGPEPKYMYQAAPGEVLHVHFIVCHACGYLSSYAGDGVYKETRTK